MKNFLRFLGVFVFLGFFMGGGGYAFAKENDNQSILKISLGVANITAHEYVWMGNFKRSELEWKAEQIPFLSVEYESDFFNIARSINNIYYGFGDGKHMIDDDWLNTKNPLINTHRSIHDVMKVDKIFGLDVALKPYPLELFRDFGIAIGGGVKYDYVKMIAFNGTYFYGCEYGYPNGCADIAVFTADEKSITYSQYFLTPYISAWFDYKIDDFFTTLNLRYSPYSFAKDKDVHHLRDTTFRGKAYGSKYFGTTFSFGMNVKKSLKMGFDFDFDRYYKKRADVHITEPQRDLIDYGNGGFDNKTLKINLFINFVF